WTIGVGAMEPATALSAFDASFAQGLMEALALLAADAEAVLLVAYDSHASGPLAAVSKSAGLLGGALVLAREPRAGAPRLSAVLENGSAVAAGGALHAHSAGNAMAQMLPLFDALAANESTVRLHAGPGQRLRLLLDWN
ncbi:MAG: beta-ketoacyl synthase chain length factor, partial [Burkholderiales bacterium]